MVETRVQRQAVPELEIDPQWLQFLQQMKIVGMIATQLGTRYPYNHETKYLATTEHRNPADFYVCQTILWHKQHHPNLGFELMLRRCFPAHPGHTYQPFEFSSSVRLGSDGVVELRAKPCFVPESDEWEEPLPDRRFPQKRQITREFFLKDHWLIRGPLTSLGPKTKKFLFSFTTQTVKEIMLIK